MTARCVVSHAFHSQLVHDHSQRLQRLLVAVRKIDLSHNLISSVKNLQSCWKLEFLTLAFNRIADVSNINQMVGNLKILNLAHNSITTTEGLEKLYSLEQLDISNNLIAKLPDVER